MAQSTHDPRDVRAEADKIRAFVASVAPRASALFEMSAEHFTLREAAALYQALLKLEAALDDIDGVIRALICRAIRLEEKH